MGNLYKQVPRGIPTYAEALGCRTQEDLKYIKEVNGKLVFMPPERVALEAAAKKLAQQASKQDPVNAGQANPGGSKQPEKTREDGSVEIPKLVEPEHVPEVEQIRASAASKPRRSPSRSGTGGPPRSRPVRRHARHQSFDVVDLDAYPNWVHNLQVHYHRPGGQFIWNPAAVKLYRSPFQVGNGVQGWQVKADMKSRNAFNANLLNWLLKHQHHIPMVWRKNGRKIFFWETIFIDARGNQCVLFISCRHQHWMMGKQPLSDVWTSNDMAAVRQ